MIEVKKLRSQLKIEDVKYCVYRLFHNDNLMYIGSTSSLKSRLITHSTVKKGLFTHVSFEKCLPSQMTEFEADAIFKEKPILNLGLPSNKKYITRTSFSAKVGEHISDRIMKSCGGFVSVNENGDCASYINIDEQVELIGLIDNLVNEFNRKKDGGADDLVCELDSISVVKSNCPNYQYYGAIDGEISTDGFDSKITAKKHAYREVVCRNKKVFNKLIDNDRIVAIIKNNYNK